MPVPDSQPDFEFDFSRRERLGFPEIVYGEAKSIDQLQRIVSQCREREHPVLISRCQPEKAMALEGMLEGGHYDPVARTWIWMPGESEFTANGKVAILSGGTADAPVVAECGNTLSFLGVRNHSFQDVGVAAIQRFLRHLPEMADYQVLIVVAGFEGALASVVAGQCPQPVIGVPTSVGYGVATGGTAALHAMLASCANGLMVMNVDNGVGAALAAKRILHTTSKN
ncbi:MAG: nickel pincer cofactor biosynthesis protein LarB [Kiritimatiellae bacterium]|jgi:NCAIR mutase (PurE)-related protein|nr:nickel pincer cofactor biosynthesis protein LarB [Kiritimatiellia bacterium]